MFGSTLHLWQKGKKNMRPLRNIQETHLLLFPGNTIYTNIIQNQYFFKNISSEFYIMTYLHMYIIITVWIFHKTEQGESLHSRKETENWQTPHTYCTPRPQIQRVKREVRFFFSHTMLQHGFVSRLFQISDQRDAYRWRVLACLGELRRINQEIPCECLRCAKNMEEETYISSLLNFLEFYWVSIWRRLKM